MTAPMTLEQIQKQLEALKVAEELKLAIERCKAGIANKGVVYRIAAESDYGVHHGGADRDINGVLTVEESAKVFQLVHDLLSSRLEETQTRLGAALQ
jgi:hypothetical protein